MKIYTNTIDLAQPVLKRFWVAPHSDFKLGVKIVNGGEAAANEFTVAAGSTELIADDEKVDGFTTYTLNSGDTGFVEYTVTVDGITQKMKVLQITTDSTVFDIDERGGDMSQYATKNWVESEISGFVDENTLSDYVETADLTAYYTKSETSSAVEIADALAGAGISIREALDNGICLPQTIFENVDGSLSSLDISGTVDFTEGRVGTGASLLSSAVRVNIGTNISAFSGRTFGWTSNLTSLVIPESVKTANVYEMFSSSKLDDISATVRFPDSLTAFGNGNPFWNARQLTIDFGDTRKTIPTIGGIASLNNGGVVILVPDALYDKWITTSPWNDTSTSASKVRPRSSRNAAQKVGKAKTGQAPIVNTIHSVYETDWATLSATADANTFYAVLPDPA